MLVIIAVFMLEWREHGYPLTIGIQGECFRKGFSALIAQAVNVIQRGLQWTPAAGAVTVMGNGPPIGKGEGQMCFCKEAVFTACHARTVICHRLAVADTR